MSSELGVCQLAVVQGVPRAATGCTGSPLTLGDALVAEGTLDVDAHHEAWIDRPADAAPIGAWLVERGLVRRSAVEAALRSQLRERIMSLFHARRIEYRFEAGFAHVGVQFIAEPMASADLVLAAMRRRLASFPREQLVRTVGPSELRLTRLGRELLRDATLWPEETVASVLLDRGTTVTEVVRETQNAQRALRFVAVLSLLSAIRAQRRQDGRYSLLVRKREQLARNVDARELLDLPRDALATDARRALRRLARELHPDTLGPDAPDALRRASSEVLGALVDAERALR